MPFRPILPPRAGHVEVEIDGQRQHKKIEPEPIEPSEPSPTEQEQINALLMLEVAKMVVEVNSLKAGEPRET